MIIEWNEQKRPSHVLFKNHIVERASKRTHPSHGGNLTRWNAFKQLPWHTGRVQKGTSCHLTLTRANDDNDNDNDVDVK